MVSSIIMPASTANRFDSCSLIKTLKPITKSEIEIKTCMFATFKWLP